MGLFSWIFGKPKNYKDLPAKITTNRQRKFELLAEDCKDWLTKADRVFVVCHFDESLESVKEVFENSGVRFDSVEFELNDDGLQRLVSAPAFESVILIHSRYLNLTQSSVDAELISDENVAAILVAEISPVQSQDLAVYRLAENLRYRCQIGYFASFQDFLASVVIGPWVKRMLEMMGFKDDEIIENRMIDRRFKEAQRRVQLQPPKDNPYSEQAWFEKYPVQS